MDVLGQAPDWSRVQAILDWFPEFDGEVPGEALYWSEGDLELFFGTQGQLKPLPTAGPQRFGTCPLLSHLRHVLAEFHIAFAAADYRSFCRHRAERPEIARLPGCADCTDVPRVQRAPQPLVVPVVIEGLENWSGSSWDLTFWDSQYGGEEWPCRGRSPIFEQDSLECAEATCHWGAVAEFADYVRTIQHSDPECSRSDALAFPRVILDNWTPFLGSAWELLAENWRELRLPGVRDLSHRWMRMFGDVCFDWEERMAGLYTVTIGPAGATTRLHKENHGAHCWHFQTEGRRLFFLFSPEDATCLHAEEGGPVAGAEAYAASVSPVDIFYPSQKRHPRFAQAKAQAAVLAAGQALVVPGGWWCFSVALETSVTVQHRFWSMDNRQFMLGEVREFFEWEAMGPDRAELCRNDLQCVHEEILEDEASDEEE